MSVVALLETGKVVWFVLLFLGSHVGSTVEIERLARLRVVKVHLERQQKCRVHLSQSTQFFIINGQNKNVAGFVKTLSLTENSSFVDAVDDCCESARDTCRPTPADALACDVMGLASPAADAEVGFADVDGACAFALLLLLVDVFDDVTAAVAPKSAFPSSSTRSSEVMTLTCAGIWSTLAAAA